ncbi:MAG: SDR family NAD(P)-dependent oxidoreductase [Deltaproteobacteria bacterium]|nr:SDR family NAD(P)-dependent oxidoreductase [Deltaproteobacteria bacterium]
MFRSERILITGASRGLGRSFARLLGHKELKNSLCLLARDIHLLKEEFGDHELIPVDLTDSVLLEKLARDKLITFSPTVVILNAGGGSFGPFIASTIESSRQTILLNMTANVLLIQILLPHMIRYAHEQHKRSKILVVSSHAAFLRVPNFALYASSKTFLNQFVCTLMMEHRQDPVDFACFCPGAMKSEFQGRSGIPQMLSRAENTDSMALFALKHFRRNAVMIPKMIDRLYQIASVVLPRFLLDSLLIKIQIYYMNKQKRSFTSQI